MQAEKYLAKQGNFPRLRRVCVKAANFSATHLDEFKFAMQLMSNAIETELEAEAQMIAYTKSIPVRYLACGPSFSLRHDPVVAGVAVGGGGDGVSGLVSELVIRAGRRLALLSEGEGGEPNHSSVAAASVASGGDSTSWAAIVRSAREEFRKRYVKLRDKHGQACEKDLTDLKNKLTEERRHKENLAVGQASLAVGQASLAVNEERRLAEDDNKRREDDDKRLQELRSRDYNFLWCLSVVNVVAAAGIAAYRNGASPDPWGRLVAECAEGGGGGAGAGATGSSAGVFLSAVLDLVVSPNVQCQIRTALFLVYWPVSLVMARMIFEWVLGRGIGGGDAAQWLLFSAWVWYGFHEWVRHASQELALIIVPPPALVLVYCTVLRYFEDHCRPGGRWLMNGWDVRFLWFKAVPLVISAVVLACSLGAQVKTELVYRLVAAV